MIALCGPINGLLHSLVPPFRLVTQRKGAEIPVLSQRFDNGNAVINCENTMIKMSSVTESMKFGGLGKIVPLRLRNVHIYLQQPHFGIRGSILVR